MNELNQVFRPMGQEPAPMQSEPQQTETLESYKQKVWEWMQTHSEHSTEENERLMKLYEDDFPEFFEDGWSPAAVLAAMVAGY